MKTRTFRQKTLLTSLAYLLFAACIFGCNETAKADNDAILGNWRWFNNESKTFMENGRVYGNGLQGVWWHVPDSKPALYIIVWGNQIYIDMLSLTDGDHTLFGRNINDSPNQSRPFARRP